MNLRDFVAETITQIELGLNDAGESTDKKYFIETREGKGIDFEAAVIVEKSGSEEKTAEGEAGIKAGFNIKMVEVSVGGKGKKKSDSAKSNSNQSISRIKFTVHSPEMTTDERKAQVAKLNANRGERKIKMGARAGL